MKVLEIRGISSFLTNFLEDGGSETLIFLRKNNDLGAGHAQGQKVVSI